MIPTVKDGNVALFISSASPKPTVSPSASSEPSRSRIVFGRIYQDIEEVRAAIRLNFNTDFLELNDVIDGFVFSRSAWHYAYGV